MARLSAPSFLLPGESPDSLWHLFCHSRLGVMHRKSSSGLAWEKESLVHPGGLSPSILREGSTYHMVFSRKRRDGSSSLLISSSVDLDHWTKPHEILTPGGVPFSAWRGGVPWLSYPELVPWKGKYRLYYGLGQSEYGKLPARFGFAQSDYLEGPYEPASVVFAPEPWGEPAVLASGPVRIIPFDDSLAALQAAVCYDERLERVYSSVLLSFSDDGVTWERDARIFESRADGWASGLVTGIDLGWKENERTWYCFFSAGRGNGSCSASSLGLVLAQRAKPVP